MEAWKTSLQRAMVSGSSASILSTLALAALGKREAGSAYAPRLTQACFMAPFDLGY